MVQGFGGQRVSTQIHLLHLLPWPLEAPPCCPIHREQDPWTLSPGSALPRPLTPGDARFRAVWKEKQMVREGVEDPEVLGREGQGRTGKLGISSSVCRKLGARTQTYTITDEVFHLVLQKFA